MRWFSFLPGVLSVLWTWNVYKGRHSIGRAIHVLEFSCRILGANPGLLALGFGTLVAVVVWSWLWMGMFTRVFLGGHLSTAKHFFIIDVSTWWLGAFFILVYLWTLGVISGTQRAITAAVTSQWYYHRNAVPAPTPQEVMWAAATHAYTTLFGTVCFSTLLALAIRLPFLLLPRRFNVLFGSLCTYTVLPSNIATLTNPLTLTYAAIHSQPLVSASRALARLSFSSSKQSLPFRARNAPSQATLHSYTLSLLLLRATRFVTALAMGFAAWVNTARSLTLRAAGDDSLNTLRGSLYAYVIGLIAAAIAWGVLGAIDGVVAGVVDAVVVCWGSEVAQGQGVRYCREAAGLFDDDSDDIERGDESIIESRGFGRSTPRQGSNEEQQGLMEESQA